MINFFSKYKIFFYIANFVLIFLYLFPGSLIGCFLYNDCKIQPQITKDLSFISANHVYAFLLLSLIALLTYSQSSKRKLVIYYLFFLSVILEILHIIIPMRSFEWSDLLGNMLGIFIVFIVYEIIKKKNYKR
ncbi:VanZ family protein [Candidatus Pelagibacter sp. HIMB1321]|uniref:VanZ family protein n=1 Tax=Candidatus Pelagibacter sp. HIMB1321 TaxID=1388755 RepID=UPI000A07FF56|nr:VanZ family protein [Candidatus Pelagibacter sp. HIMB1321]SMF81729.1 VanZ like family protein [Candidatus Pelagibacter sp. HIMB1321]